MLPTCASAEAELDQGEIARVEVVDPLTIRLHMKAPAPNQPNDLATVAIISRKHGEGAAMPLSAIADRQQLSMAYLEQIFLKLTND